MSIEIDNVAQVVALDLAIVVGVAGFAHRRQDRLRAAIPASHALAYRGERWLHRR
jgi:hypothetical protein